MSYTARSRFFAIAATLALVAAATPAGAIDPTLLPPDTELALTINVRQLLESELAKSNPETVRQLRTMAESHLADADAQRYLEKIDFDPLRDLDRITVTTAGGKMPEFILLEGKFNADKIARTGKEAADEHPDHLKIVRIEGQEAYEVRVDDNAVYVGLIGKDKMIVTPTKDGFADAVVRLKSGTKGTNKLKQAVREVVEAGGDTLGISLVATGSALVKLTEDATVDNKEQLQEVLQKITALNLSLTLDKQVNFKLIVNNKDKKSTDEMVGLAGVGLAGAKLMLKTRAEKEAKFVPALNIVETLRVNSQNNNFVLTGHITAETLGKIIKDLPQK
jgi:hypothetical protein